MSINALFQPNDYNIFCNSITESSGGSTSFVLNLSGPWAATQNCTVYISKQGKSVTLTFSQVTAAETLAASISSNNALPAQYFPTNSIVNNQLILGEDNTALVNCYANISNSGVLTVKLANGANFGGAGTGGFFSFSMTYVTA